jgi:hypothetical protein
MGLFHGNDLHKFGLRGKIEMLDRLETQGSLKSIGCSKRPFSEAAGRLATEA